jgi:type II secretory pathway pseudopilin PulG
MRLRLMVLLAALAAGCSTTPPAPPSPPPPPPLSPEATAVFARAETQGPGAALVVNMDALEQLGLAGKGPAMRQLGGVAITVMAQLSASKDPDDHEASLFARSTVMAAMLRQWADWPGVRRFALILPTSRAVHQGSTVVADELVGALAVDGGSADNPELLAGVAALVRASVWELVREDMEARVAMRGQDLCIESRELGVPFCLRPRRGLILFGTPQALDSFEALPPMVAQPATPGEAPLLIGLRVDLGAEGRGRLSFTGRDAVQIHLNLESASPKHVSMLDTVVKKGLTEYDAHQARVRERVGAALAEAQRALAQDPAAPPSLKQTATTLTADNVVDEYGYWAQARQSLQIASTQDSFSLALTVPAGAVKDLSDQLSHGGAAAPVMGAMSAMAVPGFLKLMFRQAQPEAKANLKAAYIAQKSFMAEKDRWGRTFEEIGFLPEQGRRYTYCMDKQCLPCDRQGCKVSPPPSPCQGLASVGQRVDEGFTVCAYGNLDSDDTWDVWVIDEEGEPQHLSDDAD